MSKPEAIPTVVHFAAAVNPKRILDVGSGMGAYGFLMRLYFDIGNERVSKADWILRIDGVEVFEAYRNPLWDYLYDEVILDDIRNHTFAPSVYDLVLCTDVLEHFEKHEVKPLVTRLLDAGSVVIATAPAIDYPQGAWGGNAAEIHRCQIDTSDFPYLVASVRTGTTACFVSCKDPSLSAILCAAASCCPTTQASMWRHGVRRALASMRGTLVRTKRK